MVAENRSCFPRPRLPLAALAVTFALIGGSCTVQRDQPNLVGQDVRITIMHTADMHSRIFPYHEVPNRFDRGYGLVEENGPFGGIARVATIVKRERERAARSIWLDSGDYFQGAPVFNMFKGEAEVRALSEAGIDATVVGNHEFDLGAQNLYDQLSNWATFPVLAANYIWDDPRDPQQPALRDLILPYTIHDLDGVKVGVIGMGSWSSMTGIFEGGNSLGIRPVDDAQIVTEYVRMLRPFCDVIILLSHLGLDEDQGLATSPDAWEGEDVSSLPLAGVDLILGGHLHIVLNPPKMIPNDDEGHSTILVHSGAFAKYVGRLDIVVHIGEDNNDPAKRSRITAFSYDNIPVDSRIPNDIDEEELLLPYSMELNREIDLDGVFAYVNTANQSKIVRKDLSGGDSQLGNLVARAMKLRSGVEAQVAITNSLGIRTDIEPGPLTIEQMFNVFPFENTIVVMYLSGSEIQETLDFVARKSADRGCAAQAQVAGITFDMVCDGDCGEGRTSCAKNIYMGDDCRDGNPDGDVDPNECPPLLPNGLYRVAVNDYIGRGGSGFEVLKRNASKQDTGVSLRDALIDYIRKQPACPDTVTDATDPEGRPVVDVWGQIACLDETIEPHDGRIRAIFE